MGTVRIVAGELRGRLLTVPPGQEVRPTGARVREALFSILGNAPRGVRVLDAYAGCGALGFEALSRGADEVVFIEASSRVARVLRRNAERLAVTDRVVIHQRRVLDAVARQEIRGAFGLVLADPPYASEESVRFLEALIRADLVLPGGRIVIERDRRRPPAEAGSPPFVAERTATYGDTCLDLYRVPGPPP